MGTAFLAGFGQSLARNMQIAQQRQTEDQYKKALIEQSKLQTKMLENKLNLAQQEQGLMAAYLQTKGIQLPPPPAQSQPVTAQAPKRQSLLGRIINPQPDMPAAQPVAQTQQTPIPQMVAQGQIQRQMPQAGGQPSGAFMEDLMNKRLFDMPPWRERFEAESKQVGRAVTTIGPNGQPVTILVDKTGKPMGGQIYQQPMEYGYHETQPEPGGPTYSVPVPKYGTPPALIKEQPKGETPEAAGKSQAIIGGLQDGIKFLDVIKDKKTGKINQSTIAGMTAPLMGTVGGMPGTQAREGLSLFRNAVDAIVRQRTGAQIRADEWPYYNSIYLPDYKDSPELQQSKIDRLNRDLAGALMQTDPTQTKLGRSLSVKPQLPGQQTMPAPPSGWQMTGEKSADGYPIVTDGKTKKRWGP